MKKVKLCNKCNEKIENIDTFAWRLTFDNGDIVEFSSRLDCFGFSYRRMLRLLGYSPFGVSVAEISIIPKK
jgi:hypothetical protein